MPTWQRYGRHGWRTILTSLFVGTFLLLSCQILLVILNLGRSGRPGSAYISGSFLWPEPIGDQCETIHVAFVCAGLSARLRLCTLIKSILFHRTKPLHFHILTDSKRSYDILTTLFKTWILPAVEYTVYECDAANNLRDISWIPNIHYSGIFGLTKLLMLHILPSSVDKVVVLDVDTLVLFDIAELWKLWRNFNNSQALGMADNLSDWYLQLNGSSTVRWPAMSRGYNSGVILMHLQRLRKVGWVSLFQRVVRKQLTLSSHTHLADQDVFNAVIKSQPGILYRLTCDYNYQVHRYAVRDLCPLTMDRVRIVHWNSAGKLADGATPDQLERLYQVFEELDGNTLKYKAIGCQIGQRTVAAVAADEYGMNTPWDMCADFTASAAIVHRVHMFYSKFDPPDANQRNDVTLVTQLSLDRISLLDLLLKQWNGPVSVAIYLTDAEAFYLQDYLANVLLSERGNVAVHVVYKEGPFYPINRLRNVALNAAETAFVFLCDVDFIPPAGSYEMLIEVLNRQESMSNRALIFPAFEMFTYDQSLPRNKEELKTALYANVVMPFRRDKWSKGHVATDYDRWLNAKNAYKISWSADFEPYFVVHRNVSKYDERFVGFGWNKVSHVMQLDAEGYEFYVLPDIFVVHCPHASSFESQRFRSSSLYRRCLALLKGQFMKDLAKKRRHRNLSLSTARVDNDLPDVSVK